MSNEVFEKINEARAFRKSGNQKSAMKTAELAMSLCRKSDFNSRGLVLAFLGQLQRDSDNFEKAIDLYNQALHEFTMAGSNFRIAHTIRHIADIQRHLGKFVQSEKNYEEAIIIYASSPDTNALDFANALRGYALLMENMQKIEKAKNTWKDARLQYEKSGIQDGVDECTERLSSLP